ncbi:InlB B-repeat-containing protein [Rhodohalobacter sp. 614A]|uniref:InlB B-repeat-containing protein n=1 Tax=Rhodohalobacter sp. 614A TaxID=2908649 RepID=UPI001F35D7D5|nr:metallophosphoesterase [Rhodohalobacter sp. 614A]
MRIKSTLLLWGFLGIAVIVYSCNSPSDGNKTFSLETTAQPAEGGTITPESGTFPEGEEVSIQAEPSDGWRFVRWEGNASGTSNPVTLNMSKNQSVTGVFEKRDYPLNLMIEGEGTVQEIVVTAKDYPFQTTVQLTAVAADGWQFVGWSGDLEGEENPVEIVIDKEKSITALFEKREYELNVTIEGEGQVKEEIIPARAHPYETIVKLTAEPVEGWRFEGWSGDYEGSEAVIEVTITDHTELTATFVRREYELGIEIDGQGTVQEEIIPSKSYSYQTEVQLTAIPGTEWKFDSWSGDLSGSENPITITIDGEKQVTAIFVAGEKPEVTTEEATSITSISAKVSGNIISHGSTDISEIGICYSTSEGPSVEDDCIIYDGNQDHFTVTLPHLQPLTTYFARAYVSDENKVYYGNQVSFSTIFDMDACGESVTINHQTKDGISPQNLTITYPTVSYEGMCWIVQNLGANSVAKSADDYSKDRAGWYWQFNRKQGYSNSGSGPEPQWQIHDIEENQNWEEEKDPCTELLGKNWRLPTITEWEEALDGLSSDIYGGFNSPLKLHMAGILGAEAGEISGRGSSAIFWSSTQEGLERGQTVEANASFLGLESSTKAGGRSVRCVYSEKSPKHVPNVEITDIDEETGGGARIYARILNSGTSSVQDKGVCYSTQTEPDKNDSCVSAGDGSSNYLVNITALAPNTTYFVRAYAMNKTGRSYSQEATFETPNEELETDIYVYALAAPDLTSEIFINWIDDSNDANGATQTLRYGTGSQFNKSISVTGKRIPHSDAWLYSAEVTNLNSDTEYSGRVYTTETKYTDLIHFETLRENLSGSSKVRIAFMSDIHIDEDQSDPNAPSGNPVNSMNDPSKMGYVEKKNIDVLCIAGDVVSYGYRMDETRTKQYIGFFKNHIHTYLNDEKLIPLFVVPGNHEVGFPLRGEGDFTKPTPEAGYFQLFFNNLYETTGYNFGTARAGNYLQLMGLDMFSSTPEVQKDFFDDEVKSSVSSVIPFFHSPLLEGGKRSDEDVEYSDRIRKQLAPSFANQNNIYSYFTGHIHLKFRSKPWNVIETTSPPSRSLSLGNNKYLVVDESRNRLVEFGQGYRSKRQPYTSDDKTWYIDDASVSRYNVFFTVTLQNGKHVVTEYNFDGNELYSKDLMD